MSRQALQPSEAQATVPLQGVAVEASLRGLLAEVTLTQTYRNIENGPIEALFTFPVPRDALLLDVELALGERRLRGQVVARDAAREDYEDAITDGDTAVLLEELEPGLYNLSLGNLQPGETAELRYRYAQLLHWQQGLRFALPTALAPRYGNPSASGLDPEQVPGVDLLVSYPFSFRMRVEGHLAAARVESPTHAITLARSGEALSVTLAGGEDTLDRDLVLAFSLEEPLSAEAVTVQDGDRWVALATLPLPETRDREDQAPRCIPILLDCSGSMGGDSISQAREALGAILDTLRPQDYFNIIRFGSDIEPLFPAPRAASDTALHAARRLLETLDADLGGTEIGQALDAAFSGRPEAFAVQDLLLVTDGEVWNSQAFVERARASGDRVFTVGVGSAVSEAFLRELADRTGGACELVTPREDIKARIERHFRRIYQRRLKAPRIEWPARPERQSPARLSGIYLGDTLHLFAWFRERPEGTVRFLEDADGPDAIRLETEVRAPAARLADTLPRLAARAGLAELPEQERVREAERYQLLTDQTAWLILAEQDEAQRSDGLPAQRAVPHMLAAGWGGLGSSGVHSLKAPSFECYDLAIAAALQAPTEERWPDAEPDDEVNYIDTPAFLRRSTDDTTPSPDPGQAWAERFAERFKPGWSLRVPSPTRQDLSALGIPETCIEELLALLDGGLSGADVIACFLAYLLGPYRDGMPRRGGQRVLRVFEKRARRLPEAVRASIRQLAEHCLSPEG